MTNNATNDATSKQVADSTRELMAARDGFKQFKQQLAAWLAWAGLGVAIGSAVIGSAGNQGWQLAWGFVSLAGVGIMLAAAYLGR